MAHIEVFQQRRGFKRRKQWRWRIRSSNGRIIATSGGDGYFNLSDLWVAVDQVSKALGAQPLEVAKRRYIEPV